MADDHDQARREAEERLRTFLWREGAALRTPVDMGYVTLEEAIPLLLAAYARVMAEDPAAILRKAFEAGGPAPAEKRASDDEAQMLADVDAAKPRKKGSPRLAARTARRDERPHLRLAPPPDEAEAPEDVRGEDPTEPEPG